MSEPVSPLALPQVNIVVRDMERSLAFYRLLGVSVENSRGPEWAEWALHHVNGTTSNGVRVEFDRVLLRNATPSVLHQRHARRVLRSS